MKEINGDFLEADLNEPALQQTLSTDVRNAHRSVCNERLIRIDRASLTRLDNNATQSWRVTRSSTRLRRFCAHSNVVRVARKKHYNIASSIAECGHEDSQACCIRT